LLIDSFVSVINWLLNLGMQIVKVARPWECGCQAVRMWIGWKWSSLVCLH